MIAPTAAPSSARQIRSVPDAVDGGEPRAVGRPADPGRLERAAVAGQGTVGARVSALRRVRLPSSPPTATARPSGDQASAPAAGSSGAVAVLGLGGAGQAVPDAQRGRRPQPSAHDRHDAHAVRGHRRLVEVSDALGGPVHQHDPEGRRQRDRHAQEQEAVAPPGGPGRRLQPGEQIGVPCAVRAGGNRDRRVAHQAAHRLRQVVRVRRLGAAHQHRHRGAPRVQSRLDLDPHRIAHVHHGAASRSRRGWWSSRGRSRRTRRRTARPRARPRRAARRRTARPGGRRRRPGGRAGAARRRRDPRRLGRRVGPPVAEVDPRPPAEQAAAEQRQQHQAGEQGRDEPAQAEAGSAGEQHARSVT